MSAIVLPLFLAGGWAVTFRVWRSGLEVTGAVSWFTGVGRGLRGYHAFLAPMWLSATLLWIGVLVDMFQETRGSGTGALNALIAGSFAGGAGALGLAFWMWIVQWPKFLIPPQFRDWDGK